MALVSAARSSLNPNAPIFIPAAFRQVEDFSPEWWELVKTSAWFREYWLSQHGEEDFDDSAYDDDDFDEELPFMEADFDGLIVSSESEVKADFSQASDKDGLKSVNGMKLDAKTVLKNIILTISKLPKERGPKSPPGPAKYREKPTKVVSPKCTPRRIQQPR